MKNLIIAALLLLASAARAETWLDYVPMYNSGGAVLWSYKDTTPVSAMSKFVISPRVTNLGDLYGADISWAIPDGPVLAVEEWAIRPGCTSRNPYVWLHAFRTPQGQRYEIRTLRYEYVDILANQTYNATYDCSVLPDNTLLGQPYAILNVWDQPYKMKLWMILLDASGKPDKRVYWEHKIEKSSAVYNPCWISDSWTSRPALRQTEAWWEIWPGGGETQGRWLIGGGGVPFDNKLQPQDPGTVWHGRMNVFGYNVGVGWLGAALSQDGAQLSQWCMRERTLK